MTPGASPSAGNNSAGLALITGASSGLGAEFARQLARRGCHLILVARRAARLAELAASLEQQHRITAEVLAADLTEPAGLEAVEQRLAGLENLTMLINNAGFGTTGHFAAIDLAGQLAMIQLHVLAAVRLCRAALPGMLARGQGSLINVSSMASLVPIPGSVTYCATKAYLNTFSQALQAELIGTGVKVQALCPGFTLTEFHDTDEFPPDTRRRVPSFMWMKADRVVAESLAALSRERVIYIPGFRYRLLAVLIYLTPAWLLSRVMARSGYEP